MIQWFGVGCSLSIFNKIGFKEFSWFPWEFFGPRDPWVLVSGVLEYLLVHLLHVLGWEATVCGIVTECLSHNPAKMYWHLSGSWLWSVGQAIPDWARAQIETLVFKDLILGQFFLHWAMENNSIMAQWLTVSPHSKKVLHSDFIQWPFPLEFAWNHFCRDNLETI